METQEQILESLNQQLGQTSLSERTIRDYIAGNLPNEGEEFDYAKHVKFLTSLNGNYSHDVASQVEEFKKNYKPQPNPKKEHKKEEGSQEPSEIQKLLDRIEALEKDAKEATEGQRKSQLKAQVDGLKDSLKVHNKNLWKDCVNALPIEQNDTIETLTDKAKKAYETKLREYFGTGVAPYGGKSSEKSEAEKKAASDAQTAFKAKMKAQGRL